MLYRLGDVLSVQKKSKIKANLGQNSGKYRFFTCSPIQNKYVDIYSYDNDALIVGTGGNASIHYCNEKFATSTDCLVLYAINKRELNIKWLYYYLSGHINLLANGLHGSGLKHIQKNYILSIKVNIPSIEQQNFAVNLFDLVASMRQKMETLLETYDLIIKSQFVEMFGNLKCNSMNFEILPLGKMCDVRDGTHDSPSYIEEGYPLLTSKNFSNGEIDFANVNYISETDFIAINKRSKVDYSDIVMPMIGTIGSPVIITDERPFAIKNVALIKTSGDIALSTYIKAVLESDYFLSYIDEINRGGTQKFISLGDIRNLTLPNISVILKNNFYLFVNQVDKSKLINVF